MQGKLANVKQRCLVFLKVPVPSGFVDIKENCEHFLRVFTGLMR
jgi:hypothetical protein